MGTATSGRLLNFRASGSFFTWGVNVPSPGCRKQSRCCPSVFAAVSSSALELEVACHTVGAWVLSVPRVTAPRDLLPPPRAPWSFIKLLLRGRLRGGPS